MKKLSLALMLAAGLCCSAFAKQAQYIGFNYAHDSILESYYGGTLTSADSFGISEMMYSNTGFGLGLGVDLSFVTAASIKNSKATVAFDMKNYSFFSMSMDFLLGASYYRELSGIDIGAMLGLGYSSVNVMEKTSSTLSSLPDFVFIGLGPGLGVEVALPITEKVGIALSMKAICSVYTPLDRGSYFQDAWHISPSLGISMKK